VAYCPSAPSLCPICCCSAAALLLFCSFQYVVSTGIWISSFRGFQRNSNQQVPNGAKHSMSQTLCHAMSKRCTSHDKPHVSRFSNTSMYCRMLEEVHAAQYRSPLQLQICTWGERGKAKPLYEGLRCISSDGHAHAHRHGCAQACAHASGIAALKLPSDALDTARWPRTICSCHEQCCSLAI
jgi:hypothetical protein